VILNYRSFAAGDRGASDAVSGNADASVCFSLRQSAAERRVTFSSIMISPCIEHILIIKCRS
jgi:hypothetical protein